jgi:hypothetical protein
VSSAFSFFLLSGDFELSDVDGGRVWFPLRCFDLDLLDENGPSGCGVGDRNLSVSIRVSTGEMADWRTMTVSLDCPNFKSSAGSPLVFSDNMHVSSVSW